MGGGQNSQKNAGRKGHRGCDGHGEHSGHGHGGGKSNLNISI